MRQIRIASAKNPLTDFIELNDFNGFLCTQFGTLGVSRSVDFLTIGNRNIAVNNKPYFKKYSLTIEILTKYSEYERKYYDFISFIDRNKTDGIRLYYKPYDGLEERYCLCSIESTTRIEKRQPIVLNVSQDSLWLGQQQVAHTSTIEEAQGNLFEFADDREGYFSASFSLDEKIPDYYCVAFYSGMYQQADITISGYNEVPLNIVVKGRCEDPQIFLYRKKDNQLVKKFQVFATIEEGNYLEINSVIVENGVWEVSQQTGGKRDLTELVNYANGSPYFNLQRGEYYLSVIDEGGNQCITDISWQEEYSE